MLDQHLLNFIKNKSLGRIKTPADMQSLGLFQYSESETKDCYKVGWVKYSSPEEERLSPKTWQPEFSYYINDIGFRGEYPSVDDKKILGFFGCSVTFGIGLSEDETYAKLIAQHFNKKYLNLGITGVGCHRIALTFSAATKVWDIETAVVVLPRYTRFHYADKGNHLHSILLAQRMGLRELEAVRLDILKHFSDQFLLAQTIDAIQWIIDISKLKNINLVLASWDTEMVQILNTAFDLDIITLETIDKARDGSHAGKASHKAFAEKIISIL
jgi:hypothetical protein